MKEVTIEIERLKLEGMYSPKGQLLNPTPLSLIETFTLDSTGWLQTHVYYWFILPIAGNYRYESPWLTANDFGNYKMLFYILYVLTLYITKKLFIYVFFFN